VARQYKNPGSKPASGNSTDARGKPTRVRLRITDEAGKRLNRIWKARSEHEPGITEDEIVSALIMQMAEPIVDAEIMTALYDTSAASDEENPIIL
jgi:hypothetical protein